MYIKIPVIKVRDKTSGTEHIVGTDIHDTLCVTEEGRLTYRNLQNGEETSTRGDYEFVAEPADPVYEPTMYLDFVSLDEYIALLTEAAKEQNDREEAFQKAFSEENIAKFLEAYNKKAAPKKAVPDKDKVDTSCLEAFRAEEKRAKQIKSIKGYVSHT